MVTKNQFNYKIGESTGRIIDQIAALSVWMSETTDLLHDLHMLEGDFGGSATEEEDVWFDMYYKLKKRLSLYAGLSIGDQLDAQRLSDLEPASNVTI